MTIKILHHILYSSILFITLTINAQAPYGNAGEHTAVNLGSPDAPFGYYEYLPTDFNPSASKTYPLILFYHGLGEKGNGATELSRVIRHGPPKLIEQGTDFDAIVISPQSGSGWFSTANFLSLYNYLTTNYPIDLNKVYVTGLSAGGGSTWNALKGHYDKIAAAVPICGAGSVNTPSEFLQQTPIWAHHNFSDGTVAKGQTINNMNRIANVSSSVMDVYPYGSGNTAADGDYTMQFDTSSNTWSVGTGINIPVDKMSFTLYKNGNHDAWTKTYNNQNVWNWMFTQSLSSTLSVNEIEKNTIKLYPNPINNKLNIITQNNSEKRVEIFDIIGRKVYSNVLFKELEIDMNSYTSGTYFAKIIAQNANEKVVKVIVN